MKTAVDTNILFDLLAGDDRAVLSARQALSDALSAGPLVICPVVYAELAAGFSSQAEVTAFIHDLQLRLEDFSADALFQAATAWRHHAARRGVQVQCPRCGHKVGLRCTACDAPLAWRQHIIPDFMIGAHALHQADRLLTRDAGYYRRSFPRLRLLAPE